MGEAAGRRPGLVCDFAWRIRAAGQAYCPRASIVRHESKGLIKFCALTSQPFGVPTVVNLNSIIVDGTGMCGACRVEVGGRTRFACVDGPEFDGHAVNWDQLMARQRI
jgi:hypothetical protein